MVVSAVATQSAVVVGLVALAATALAFVAAERTVEHLQRARLLRRLGSMGIAASEHAAVRAEIIRRDSDPAGRWLTLLRHVPFTRHARNLLDQAGLEWSTTLFVRLILACGATLALLGLGLRGSPLVALGGAVVGAALPVLYVRRRKRKRLALIEGQLPEAIDLLTRAIRAGHALNTAMRTVADESPEPLASEFRRVFDEQKYGFPFEKSLRGLASRVDLIDVRVIVIAILVQREVGGNLAEILDNISQLIRSRFMLRRQVEIFTAQGRMSGWVLGALPIALGVVIQIINPEYIALLFTDPAGRVMLAIGVTLQLVGYFWISRVLKLDL